MIAAGVNLMGGRVLLVPTLVLLGLAVVLIAGTAVLRRRSVRYDAASPGMFGVTGRMGGGKSYFLTWMAWTALGSGRPVFSTYELAGSVPFAEYVERLEAGSPVVGPVVVESWRDIVRVPNGSLVIVDEAHGWWPSAAYRSPVEVNMWISTLRHRGITFFWATQWVGAVARWLRELSFGIWECENFKAGHRYTLYDPRVIGGKPGTRKSEARIVVRRRPEVMALYDTRNTATWSLEWGGGASLAGTLDEVAGDAVVGGRVESSGGFRGL